MLGLLSLVQIRPKGFWGKCGEGILDEIPVRSEIAQERLKEIVAMLGTAQTRTKDFLVSARRMLKFR
jgi:hypothetical protein